MECVVCGKETGSNHKCPKRVLAARLAVETRAINQEFGEYETPRPAENIRLFSGLAMLEAQNR